MREIGLPQARRIALAAQGFGRPRPDRAVTMRDVQREIDRLAQFQIDSISVLARAHQMPLYSRLGPYDLTLLERASSTSPRRLFEYWGHAASLLDVRLEPALRFRMARAADEAWGGMQRVRTEHPRLVEFVLDEVCTRTWEVRLRGELVTPRLQRADTMLRRMRGLLGRGSLPADEGLWIDPCDAIHMFFMRFSIDAIFIDEHLQVVRVCEDLKPWRMARGGKHAHSVLELPPGKAAFFNIRVGDKLQISPN